MVCVGVYTRYTFFWKMGRNARKRMRARAEAELRGRADGAEVMPGPGRPTVVATRDVRAGDVVFAERPVAAVACITEEAVRTQETMIAKALEGAADLAADVGDAPSLLNNPCYPALHFATARQMAVHPVSELLAVKALDALPAGVEAVEALVEQAIGGPWTTDLPNDAHLELTLGKAMLCEMCRRTKDVEYNEVARRIAAFDQRSRLVHEQPDVAKNDDALKPLEPVVSLFSADMLKRAMMVRWLALHRSTGVRATLSGTETARALFAGAQLLLPHSCAPNLVTYFDAGGTAYNVALVDISEGDELSVSLSPETVLCGTRDRLSDLAFRHHFECVCRRCCVPEPAMLSAPEARLAAAIGRVLAGAKPEERAQARLLTARSRPFHRLPEFQKNAERLDRALLADGYAKPSPPDGLLMDMRVRALVALDYVRSSIDGEVDIGRLTNCIDTIRLYLRALKAIDPTRLHWPDVDVRRLLASETHLFAGPVDVLMAALRPDAGGATAALAEPAWRGLHVDMFHMPILRRSFVRAWKAEQ